ncbi:MAG TPA: hypothetical protein VF837_00410 [Patescibacteria group bacterium]
MANDTVVKETPVQFAERTLKQVENLLAKFQREIPEDNRNQWSQAILDFQDVGITEANAQEAIDAMKAIRTKLTQSRVENIRRLVQNSLDRWANNKLAERFILTDAYTQANKWLEGVALDADVRTVLDWIQNGWDLLKVSLNAPWGTCKCGNRLVPIQVKTREGMAWKVFDLCSSCYHAERDSETNLALSTTGQHHKVSKPGSASRRHAARGIPPKAHTEVQPDGQKKRSKREKTA